MENSHEKKYEILFMGPVIHTDEERERVIQGLQARFNLPQESAIQLVRRAPIVVKRGVTEKEGDRYVEAFHSIGAMVRVREYSRPNDMAREGGAMPYLPGEEEKYCPWEDLEELGFFEAFLTTLKEALLSPTRFYRRMPTRGGFKSPLIFGLILGVLGGVFSLTWQQVFMLRLGRFPEMATTYFVGIIIALPLIVLASLYIISAIVHLCLTVVGGNRRGFEATFRVIAYSGSTDIFAFIPFIGSLITFIYALVIVIIGLREGHGIGKGRAALAVFLPIIVILALFLVVALSLLYKLSEFL
ncbi:MAG: YIP1 family protein [Syntrophobacterales bacterium]|nr:MAG: YIP1 family protein [Syntrophobacterales bacterium]